MFKSFLKTVFWVFIAILSGRILGFFREVLIAKKFGVSASADSVALMTLAPDFFTSIILGTAFAGSFIPMFNQLKTNERLAFYQTVATKTLGIGLLLWAACALLAPILVSFFAGSLTGSNKTQAVSMLRLDLAVIPLTLLTGVFIAHLQAQLKQVAPAYATVVFNSILIIGLLYFVNTPKQWVFVLIMAALSRLLFVWLLNKQGYRWFSIKQNANWKQFLNTYTTVWLGSTLFLTLIPLISRAIASQLGEGELALFSYAQKLIELPKGLLISVIGVTLLPQLSRLFKEDSSSKAHVKFKQLTTKVLLFTLALSYSACFVLLAVSYAYSDIIFGLMGELDKQSISNISALVFIGMFSMPALGVIAVGNATLLSQHKSKLMLKINITSVVLFFFLVSACVLTKQLTREYIMLSWSIACILAAGWMLKHLIQTKILSLKSILISQALFITTGMVAFTLIKTLPEAHWFSLNASITLFLQAALIGIILLVINFGLAYKTPNRDNTSD